MAQLPPRAPTMPFPPPHHTHAPPPPPSWVDEFLDFTSARRGTHRRSMSDSVTFLDPPLHSASAGFDRFDDDQLMSMFSDDFPSAGGASVVPSLGSPKSEPSSPNSDRHSNADEEKPLDLTAPVAAKTEHGEVESSCNGNGVDNTSQKHDSDAPAESGVDPKRVKRILANRQSAQRSRVRKLQYISELERSVTTLQTEVSALSPRVAFLDHQRLILSVDNSAIKQRIAALAQDKIFKDAHQEALKKEIERLRQIYHQQNMKNLSNNNNNNNNSTGEQAATDNSPLTDQKMQLITS